MAPELIRRIDAKPEGRLIVVGDIHGCYEELRELLRRVAPSANDLVMSVGDVVTKGPAADRCLDFWRDRGYLAVRGNNEVKTLANARSFMRYFANEEVLHRTDLLLYIRSWPLVIDFPSENVTVVHGGFLPNMNVTQEDVERERNVISELRWIRKQNGEWRPIGKEKRKKDDVLWSEKWRGDRFVLYGHTPLREPRRDKMALGLDTGCVYGGALTAAIYDDGEWETVSVKAKRKYAV